MNRAYAEARDNAKMAAREGQDFLNAKSKVAYKVGEKLQRAYPTLVSNLRNNAQARAAELREVLRTHGPEVAAASSRLYKQGVHSVEFKLLKAGAIFALWRYLSRNPQVAEVTERVKAEVKAEPVQAAVVALGIGFLIGRILG